MAKDQMSFVFLHCCKLTLSIYPVYLSFASTTLTNKEPLNKVPGSAAPPQGRHHNGTFEENLH
jgi:hypothetical protein